MQPAILKSNNSVETVQEGWFQDRSSCCFSESDAATVWGTLRPESRGQAAAVSAEAGDCVTRRSIHWQGVYVKWNAMLKWSRSIELSIMQHISHYVSQLEALHLILPNKALLHLYRWTGHRRLKEGSSSTFPTVKILSLISFLKMFLFVI